MKMTTRIPVRRLVTLRLLPSQEGRSLPLTYKRDAAREIPEHHITSTRFLLHLIPEHLVPH